MNDQSTQRIAVVGAGVVGSATALALARDGHAVTLIDPEPPGEACSFGNAATLAEYAVQPFATPGILRDLPGMIANPDGPLAVRLRHLPRAAPWLWHFLRAARPAEVERIAGVLAELVRDTVARHRALLGPEGAARLMRERGMIMLYGSARARAKAEPGLALRRRFGVPVQDLNIAEAAQMEPAIARVYAAAVYLPGAAHVVSPLKVTRFLVDEFQALGGRLERRRVRALTRDANRPALVTAEGGATFDAVVLSAGAWSRELARTAGVAVRLDVERGYHVVFPELTDILSRPVSWTDGGFYLVPLEDGVRCAGTVEFAGMARPADWRRADTIAAQARRLLPDAGEPASRWMGMRPSMPDSLPVIGRAPGQPGLYFNFGHGHLGITLAPRSAGLIADLIAGRAPDMDLTPLRAERF